MLKKIIYLCFLVNFSCFSQEVVSSTYLNLKKNHDVFQVVDNPKEEVTIFVSDKIKVTSLLLNKEMKLLDSITAQRPSIKAYPNMIGYNISNGNTRLFWSSNNHENINAQLFDFNTRTTTSKDYTLVLKNEKVLQKFSEDSNFYILTALKDSDNFKLHIFDNEGNYSVKTIALEGFHFYLANYSKSTLYGVLGENLLPFEPSYTLQKITVEDPTSIADAAKLRKCYFNKNELVITIDTNVDYTQMIIIDLKEFKASEKIIRKPSIAGEKTFQRSNSFYFENKLHQIKSSSAFFHYTIKDLDDNIIKQYSANGDTPIDFKNSEIYQEGGDFGGKRILGNSSQFIRKINSLNAGITCYNIGQNTLITFGGISPQQQSTSQFALGQFGLIGALVYVAIYNPTMESFNSYANRKVVKIEGLFDSEGNHLKGDLKPLAFDKIRTFFDTNTNVSSQILFKMDAYYLGYYDIKAKEYIIRKFID